MASHHLKSASTAAPSTRVGLHPSEKEYDLSEKDLTFDEESLAGSVTQLTFDDNSADKEEDDNSADKESAESATQLTFDDNSADKESAESINSADKASATQETQRTFEEDSYPIIHEDDANVEDMNTAEVMNVEDINTPGIFSPTVGSSATVESVVESVISLSSSPEAFTRLNQDEARTNHGCISIITVGEESIGGGCISLNTVVNLGRIHSRKMLP